MGPRRILFANGGTLFMKALFTGAWAALLITTTMGCGEKDPFGGRQRQEAPRGAGDVGVLVEQASLEEIVQVLEQNPAAQVRVLNREHGLYEIFGVSAKVLEKSVQGKVNRNQFFDLVPQSFLPPSKPAPEGLEIPGFNACKGGSGGPTAVLTGLAPTPALDGATIQLGQRVKVSALRSHAAPATAQGLRTAMLITYPRSSGMKEQMVVSTEFDFTPEALGVHKILLVVQDARDLCAVESLRFVVTANRPYGGPVTKPINMNLAHMKHLAALNAQESWQISEGEGVLIAVIDSGVNYNHPLLAANIQTNDGEIPGNKIDDDKNGRTDDFVGYDFANDDAFPFDDEGHGSHVAGLAAGLKFGMAQKAKILPIKALSGIGGDVGSLAAAILYAVDRHAKIINLSLGAPAPIAHPAMVRAVDYAESKGVLIVTAAGNGHPRTGLGFDIDEIPFFPASLPHANIVAVAAFDSHNVLSPYSNFGANSVDVVAPGGLMPEEPTLSTTLENPRHALFSGMSGTSMATPLVSGMAAQLISLQPRLSLAEIKDILIKAGEQKPELALVSASGRHINALKVLELASDRNVLF